MIKIATYQRIYQGDIDKMILEISLEFDEPISVKSTKAVSFIPNAYWVALKNKKVIGTVAIIVLNKEIGVLKKMFLKKTFRGKNLGVSKLLFDTAISWCEKNNVNEIYLGTMHQFKAAQLFYKKNGFQRVQENELPMDFPNNTLDKIFYYKILKQSHF